MTEPIFKCQVCGGAVASRKEVYAVIRQRYDFSDNLLDEPAMHVRTYHALCSTVDASIYTLSDHEIEAIVQELLDEPAGFVYTLNAPYARGYRYPGDDDPARDDRYLATRK